MRPAISSFSKSRIAAAGINAQIAEALPLVEEALRGGPGPFALQAAIAALHCQAARAEDTDWPQIVRLYDLLERLQPSPIVSLNRAVAVAMVDGPQPALALIDALAATGDLDGLSPAACRARRSAAPPRILGGSGEELRDERSRWSPMTASADFSSGGCAKFSRQSPDRCRGERPRLFQNRCCGKWIRPRGAVRR